MDKDWLLQTKNRVWLFTLESKIVEREVKINVEVLTNLLSFFEVSNGSFGLSIVEIKGVIIVEVALVENKLQLVIPKLNT